MSPLKRKLARLIAATGPLSVADYMAHCLFDPEHGYYTTREPFGVSGDFTTAPEISQMFGEILGVWVAAAWQALGRPESIVLAEIGPGRGTLMKDMLRSLASVQPVLLGAAKVALVETSPRLTRVQKQTLAGAPAIPAWVRDVDELPEGPLIIVGNELFDAVPLRQFVKTPEGWCERVVGVGSGGDLAFMAGPSQPDAALLPPGAGEAPVGSIVEHAPARSALMERIAARIATDAGAGLFVDYGYSGPAIGDTLQAVYRHRYDDVLARPGEADLTAHVDFAALRRAAEGHGLHTRLMEQGDFLLSMGLLERAGALGAQGDETIRIRLQSEVDRLARPEKMGSLFKVLMLAPIGVDLPPVAD
jgi:SAM-dependent MidA family methyltransferase